MKKLMYLLIVPLSVLLLSGLGEATVTLSLTPSSQSTTIGGTVILDLEIAGLTDYGPGSLGAFALDISYNPDILSFTSVSFGLSLGDPDWFEADPYYDDSVAGDLYLDETSFLSDSELDSIQPANFTLLSLSFTGIAAGFSDLVMQDVVLSYASGSAIPEVEIKNASLQQYV